MKRIILVTLASSLTACSFGSAKPASAVQNAHIGTAPAEQRKLLHLKDTDPVKNVAIQTFEPTDVSLQAKTNLFIFWQLVNGQVNPNDVAAVISLSQKVQADEDEQFLDYNTVGDLTKNVFASAKPVAIDPILTRADMTTLGVPASALQDPVALKTQLDAQLAPAQTALNTLNTANPDDKATDDDINSTTTSEKKTQADLNAENAKPNPDPAVVQALTQQIAGDDSKIQADRKKAPAGQLTYRQYYAKAQPLEAKINGISAVEAVIQPSFAGAWLEWVTAYDRAQAIVNECSDYITEIIGGTLSTGKIAPPHVMPVAGSVNPELTVHFGPKGEIDMKIDQWFPPVGWESPDGSDTDSAPIFTTDDGSIRNVSYTPLGGVFEFTVVTRWASYGFKIARTHYDAADHLQHYQGEINLYSDDASQPMRGVAVLDQTSQQE